MEQDLGDKGCQGCYSIQLERKGPRDISQSQEEAATATGGLRRVLSRAQDRETSQGWETPATNPMTDEQGREKVLGPERSCSLWGDRVNMSGMVSFTCQLEWAKGCPERW